jgi:hypothetical protein
MERKNRMIKTKNKKVGDLGRRNGEIQVRWNWGQ